MLLGERGHRPHPSTHRRVHDVVVRRDAGALATAGDMRSHQPSHEEEGGIPVHTRPGGVSLLPPLEWPEVWWRAGRVDPRTDRTAQVPYCRSADFWKFRKQTGKVTAANPQRYTK